MFDEANNPNKLLYVYVYVSNYLCCICGYTWSSNITREPTTRDLDKWIQIYECLYKWVMYEKACTYNLKAHPLLWTMNKMIQSATILIQG